MVTGAPGSPADLFLSALGIFIISIIFTSTSPGGLQHRLRFTLEAHSPATV